MRRAARAVPLVAVLVAAALAACGSKPPPDALGTLPVRDAGPDGGEGGASPAPEAGIDPSLGGPCVDDAQCDDGVACTFDRCDPAAKRCRYAADDAQCDDGVHCNGRETCVLFRGCAAGGVVACDDANACTIDRCVEATKACARGPRDADGDGDPDARCAAAKDCDDDDPLVASTASEVCGNGKDDDCDGEVDEAACVVPAGDTCAAPFVLPGPGTYALSTAGAARDFAPTCTVTAAPAARDVVAKITVPAGAPRDLDVTATATSEVALAIGAACGESGAERTCASVAGATTMRARAHALPPGEHFVTVTTQGEAEVTLAVVLGDATAAPANEGCAAPASVALETPFVASLVGVKKDLESACATAVGELTYALDLAAAQDVRVYASTIVGQGTPVLGLRSAACAAPGDELRCRSVTAGNGLPLFARALPAGRYVLTVSATAPIDASVLVRGAPPTAAPADQSCTAPPAALVGGATPVDLRDREDAIRDECLPGWPNAAFALDVVAPSDVLLVGRFPLTGTGAVSLGRAPCRRADRITCATGGTPVRTARRNLQPGAYRIVVGDTTGQSASLSAYLRPTTAPVGATLSDTCATAVDVPATGAFFFGDTSVAGADFPTTCDAPGQAGGGARDQILRLALSERKRVLLSTDGATFPTVLELRRGAACPGQPVAGACHVGFGPQRSFLDVVLDPDVYWIVVDGYAGDQGQWNLDVHVAAP